MLRRTAQDPTFSLRPTPLSGDAVRRLPTPGRATQPGRAAQAPHPDPRPDGPPAAVAVGGGAGRRRGRLRLARLVVALVTLALGAVLLVAGGAGPSGAQ